MASQNLEYVYDAPTLNASHDYLLPAVDAAIRRLRPQRIFDLGCGNGSIAKALSKHCEVEGIDASESAVHYAKTAYPELRIEQRSAYDDLATEFGTYDAVISLEVVEHLYDPRLYARNLFSLLKPGGTAILSTPYHGYTKNLVMALSGKLDQHFTALWDGGHIKFWSTKTLTALLEEAGFERPNFIRVGRIPPLAKSMIAIARRNNA